MSLKKKWSSNSDDKIYYDREGLMNVMDLVGYWFFYSDILLVGNCLKRNSGLSEA